MKMINNTQNKGLTYQNPTFHIKLSITLTFDLDIPQKNKK